MLRTREGRALLFAYAAVAVVCACLPLADHLGFEFAAALTVACALGSPFVGFAAMRMERSAEPDRRRPARAAFHAGLFAVGGLALPTVLILLNGVRRPLCDPATGFFWLLVLAAPTAWLGATLGALARLLASRLRWAIGIVALVQGTSIVTSLAVAYVGPAVFVFDHVFGYFPGPLYDETIPISAALLSFRAATVLWGAAAVAVAGALATGDRVARRMHRAWVFALSAALIVTSVVWGSELGWRTTDRSLRAALPGEIHVDGLVLHFSRNLPDRDIERLVRDATFDAAEVARSLGITPKHPIHVWMYRDGAQKRRLVGAEGTQFAKPYRHEIHIDPRGYPHGSMQHELVHAMAGEFASGPWRTPGGLVPNSALVEGVAVAFDLDDGILTPTQEAKAMRDLKLAPRLEHLLGRRGFASESSTRAYTYSGAFIRYLTARFGIGAMRNLYFTGDLATLGPPEQLVRDF